MTTGTLQRVSAAAAAEAVMARWDLWSDEELSEFATAGAAELAHREARGRRDAAALREQLTALLSEIARRANGTPALEEGEG